MGFIDRALEILAKKTLVLGKVSDEKRSERMLICEGCPYMDKESVRCKVCLCYLEAKTRAAENFNPIRMRNEVTHCPMGNWGDLEIANFYRKMDKKPLIVTETKIQIKDDSQNFKRRPKRRQRSET